MRRGVDRIGRGRVEAIPKVIPETQGDARREGASVGWIAAADAGGKSCGSIFSQRAGDLDMVAGPLQDLQGPFHILLFDQ